MDESKQEFERLNIKLDKIIKALESAGLKKESVVIKPVKNKKPEEISAEEKTEEKEVSMEEKTKKKQTKKKTK